MSSETDIGLQLFSTGIAERSGADVFSRISLFCLCLFVNKITSERLNVGWWNMVVGALLHPGRAQIPRSHAPFLGPHSQKCGPRMMLPMTRPIHRWFIYFYLTKQQNINFDEDQPVSCSHLHVLNSGNTILVNLRFHGFIIKSKKTRFYELHACSWSWS